MRRVDSNFLHLAALAALALVVSAAIADASEVKLSDAWIRALPAHLPAGGYFTLHNGSSNTLSLTGANSPACGMLMLHKSDSMAGMAHMEDVDRVDVPAGGTVKFAPGGYHLMCMDPTPAIKVGNKVPVTLNFVDGSSTTAEFVVRSPSGK